MATVVISSGDEILDCLKGNKDVAEEKVIDDSKTKLLADAAKSSQTANELK